MTRINRRTSNTAADAGVNGHARTIDRIVGAGAPSLALVRDRVATLGLVDDPRVCAPERVASRADGAITVTMPWVDGIDLAAFVSQQGFLSIGECVYIGIHLSEALAAMHAVGVAHGDVSLANVMVTRDGLVVVDTAGGALPTERGTPGFTAPERSAGATTAADVYSVGALLKACVDPAMLQAFMGWLDPLLDDDPAARPRAAAVAAGIPKCATPIPVRIQDHGIVGDLRAHAHEPLERTTLVASARPWRVRRRALRLTAVLAVTLGLGAAVTQIVPRADTAIAGEAAARPAGQTEQSDGLVDPPEAVEMARVAESPEAAARDLTESRFEALAGGDAQSLLATVDAQSPAAQQLAPQAQALAAGTLTFEGLSVDVVSATVVPGQAEAADGRERAAVNVTYDIAAHTVHSGATVVEVEAHRESALLQLAKLGTTWLVETVLPES